MTRRHTVATNIAVLDALGMGDPKLMIVSATLDLTSGSELPTVTIKRYLSLDDASQYVFETREITGAKRVDKSGFDLDAMCAAARGRLADYIDDMAADALEEFLGEMVVLRYDLEIPVRKHHIDACGHYFDDAVEWRSFYGVGDWEPFYVPRIPIGARAAA